MSMKVLFLTNIPSPYRVEFFQELGKMCSLTVLYELEKASDRNSDWEKVITDKRYKEVYLKPLVRQTSSAWCPSVKKYLRERKFDIVVVGVYSTPTGMQAVHYLKKNRIPYLLNCDGGMISHGEGAFRKKLKTFLIGGAAAYLSTGNVSDEYLVYYGAERNKIYHYPFTSIHEEDLPDRLLNHEEKILLRKQLNIQEEKMILTAGNFIARKGFDVLLEAAGLMDGEYGIYLVGGEEIPEYQAIRERLHLEHIHYVPFMQKEVLQLYYQAADLFVLPTREDIWGLVINEAMAAGLPVITTDKCVAGVEMLDAEYLVPVEDAKTLAAKSEALLNNDKQLQQAAEMNLARSREYTIENMAKIHADIFADFLKHI